MDNQKPHDLFFKKTFGKVDVAKSFLEHYSPSELLALVDIDSLEPQKDSYVRDELSEVFSDLLFRATIENKRGYFYFLFEHKSYQSKFVALQLLSYMVEIWKELKEEKNALPVIIPMIIAHGRSEWKKAWHLTDLIQGYDQLDSSIQKYVPVYDYLLFDLSDYRNDEIKGNVQLRVLMEVFRDIFTADTKKLMDTIVRSVQALQELEDEDTKTAYFQTLIHYIFNVKKELTKKEVVQLSKRIEQSYPEGGKNIMSFVEEFRQEGIQKGRQEGRLLQHKEDIQRLLEEQVGEEAKSLCEMVYAINDLQTLSELKWKLYRTKSDSEIKTLIMEASE